MANILNALIQTPPRPRHFFLMYGYEWYKKEGVQEWYEWYYILSAGRGNVFMWNEFVFCYFVIRIQQ